MATRTSVHTVGEQFQSSVTRFDNGRKITYQYDSGTRQFHTNVYRADGSKESATIRYYAEGERLPNPQDYIPYSDATVPTEAPPKPRRVKKNPEEFSKVHEFQQCDDPNCAFLFQGRRTGERTGFRQCEQWF